MSIDRYHRQALLPQIGRAGQERLRKASVLLVGCGALGSVIAEQLVRAGIGRLRLADRDIVELTNLQRQVLFDEEDVREQTPKAIATERRLRRVNSEVEIDARVTDVHAGNVEELAGCDGPGRPVDLILDGTDNVDTRNLLNDAAVKHGIPWIYGACVGTEGRCMAILPPSGPCLRCVFSDPPAAAELPTCDTAGVLAPAAAVVASLQVTAALRVLLGQAKPQSESLISMDVWRGRFHSIPLIDAKRADCPTCGRRAFAYLDCSQSGRSTSLCGRNAVQIRSAKDEAVDLSRMAAKLSQIGRVQQTPYLLRCALHDPREIQLTVFPDGRAIIQGTADFERARSIYARFVGS
ncbi:MAG TPA: ThiF family adenylyltransferase [Tepidisphaeraceae bacterium]